MSTRMVCGFLFNSTCSTVALIKKNRPLWQAGKLNGIGGHVERSESDLIAMQREFYEETGYAHAHWREFCEFTVSTERRIVTFFADATSDEFLASLGSRTDEQVVIYDVNDLLTPVGNIDQDYHLDPNPDFVYNLRWLIPMAIEYISRDEDQTFSIVSVDYREDI